MVTYDNKLKKNIINEYIHGISAGAAVDNPSAGAAADNASAGTTAANDNNASSGAADIIIIIHHQDQVINLYIFNIYVMWMHNDE